MALRRQRDRLTTPPVPFTSKDIDLTSHEDARYMRSIVPMSRSKSLRAWQWYHDIGEVHYAVSRSAKVAGYVRLRAVKINPDGTPGDAITGGAEPRIVEEMMSPFGGVRGFAERYFTLSKIPGDAYLIACRDKQDNLEGYDWLGASEIAAADMSSGMLGDGRDSVYKANQKIDRILAPAGEISGGGQLTTPVLAKDFIGRVWRPGGQYVAVPDSPMRALDMECEILDLLTKNIRAKLLSRFALNGIFFVPSEIAAVRSGQPKGKDEYHDNQILNRLIQAATWAVQNHEQPEAAIPIFMTGPGQYGEMIKHITADRQLYEVDMKLRGELIDRILAGLDTQPSTVDGNKDTNHWGAWTQMDEERRVNIQPDIETMCWALTRLVLRKRMVDEGLPVGRIMKTMVWYDLTPANAKTNLAEDSRQLRDRILIGDEATRRLSGIAESDAPSDDEQVRMVGVKSNVPYLALWGLDVHDKIDWTMVQSSVPGPDANSPAGDPQSGPGVGDPGSPNDKTSNTPKRLTPGG